MEGTIGRCEMDTHADTCVAGANFLVCEFDGTTCEVTPFTDQYQAMKGIPIVSAATAWTDEESGETIILFFNQVLWYGDKINHSLINPNQLRYHGIPVCDDITDRNRRFGIEVHSEVFIPFEMKGTTIYFESRVPSKWEMKNCRIIVMTDNSVWDPENVTIAAIKPTRITGGRHMIDNPIGGVSEAYDQLSMMQQLISAVNITNVSYVGAKHRHSQIVTAEEVARKFRCGIETAKQTLKTTTQHGVRQAIHPLQRMYCVDHIDINRWRLRDTFYMDTLFSKVKSIKGNVCAQVITNGQFTRVYPMPSKASEHIAQALRDFIDDVGVPDELVCDLATEQVGVHTPVMQVIRRHHIKMHYAEKGRSKQNHRAETEIRELKQRWKNRMTDRHVPSRLWDYGLVYIAEILSIIARGKSGRPGIEAVMGHTVNISEWLDFEFYDYVWYWDEKDTDMTDEQQIIGRWLGILYRVGSDMTYWVLTETGNVIARSTVQHITQSDMSQEASKRKLQRFDEAVTNRFADEHFVIMEPDVFYLEDVEAPEPVVHGVVPQDDEYGDMIQEPRPDVDDVDTYDRYLNAEIMIERDGEPVRARVVKRARADTGAPIGRAHANPLFDTREYDCIFDDGTTDRYTANIIAENLYSQCDSEGRSFLVLKEIVDHAKDNSAIPISDGFMISYNGNRVPKKTTRGWKLLCEWKDGTTSWVSLVELKDSNPVELAEYAVANRIDQEPAFRWWVADVLKKRNRIIAKLKRRYWRITHKFGIRLPKSVEEAIQIDRETNTTFWTDAIKKEMERVGVAFDFIEEWTPEQVRQGAAKGDFVGYQEIECHMVFDVKMDLTRKARFVAGGHTTETPTSLTYSSVVSRDSIRIAFLMAALLDVNVMSCDISNAYLNAPCREKIWFVAGPEFGSQQGQVVKIVRALYGLKSSGASWRSVLKQVIIGDLGFEPTIADPDAYQRRTVHPHGIEYWELLLVYVDDILIISHEPQLHLQKLNQFHMSAVGRPD
jgi:hypothetical protein